MLFFICYMLFLDVIFLFFGYLIKSFGLAMVAMPYTTGAITILFLVIYYPPIKNLIPGHPVLSVISALALIEFFIHLLTRYEQTSKAFIVFTCTLLINTMMLFYFSSGKRIDSYQLAIFMTIVYLITTLILVIINLGNLGNLNKSKGNIIFTIFSGILYAISAGFTVAIIVDGIWKSYFYYIKDDDFIKQYEPISLTITIISMIITFIAYLFKDGITNFLINKGLISQEHYDREYTIHITQK